MSHFKRVLFIAVDDLRPEINCFGKKKLHTPNIDKLANHGTQFNRAYCQIPLCMPSRASLMSGIRPDRQQLSHIPQICVNGEPSLPGHLKAHGYDTVSIGKVYHFNNDDSESWTKRYTDTFYEQDLVCDGYCSGYQLEENKKGLIYSKTGRNTSALTECVDAPDNAYPDGIIAEKAIMELRESQKQDKPLFLAVGFYRPHLPWAVPKKYWDLYSRDEVDLADNPFFPKDGIGKSTLGDLMHYGDNEINETYSDFGKYRDDNFPVMSEDKQRECVHGYWASVSFTDAQIGKVIDELEQLGLMDETVIVLWGDNGWHLGEHKLWSKVTSFEESTRIPLVVSVPGVTSGEQCDALVELIDLYPTLCELTELERPAHLEGSSALQVLNDPLIPWKEGVFSRIGDAETIITKRYRFTRYSDATLEGDVSHLPNSGECELFDLELDPRENVNVAKRAEYSEVVRKLDAQLSAGWQAEKSMKVSFVCHGNIARSQVLHQYMAKYASVIPLNIDLFSCGTAARDTYPNADILLNEVRMELRKRGLHGPVERNVLDDEAVRHLIDSDLILVADMARKKEVLSRLGDLAAAENVALFYEYIGEGRSDFVDTYNRTKAAQDPARFAQCFDELERIAQVALKKIQETI
ncbi:MAG: sulfatase-like hydrolase/transferase [Spirochaetales bacterium]|jgi:iduronate 2-sulfatase|nr:sulfatase-like hydrolase/transferase [Spirochaetales bacterium]